MARHCKEPGCTKALPEPTGRGRPQERCEEHRARRRHRREAGKPRSIRLTAVPTVADEPDPLPADFGDDFPEDEAPNGPMGVAAVARRDLERVMSSHPASDTLGAVATLLAETLDAPTTRSDPRAVAAVSKELRATLADLTRAEEAGDADPFGLDGVPAPVVVSPAS